MTRRILLAIVATTALAVTAFAIPLAVAVRNRYRTEEFLELQRIAAEYARSVPDEVGSDTPIPESKYDPDHDIGIYSNNRLVVGEGPATADSFVLGAVNDTASGQEGTALVTAIPLRLDQPNGTVIRVAENDGEVLGRTRTAWLIMALMGLAAIGLAAAVGWSLARRLGRPVRRLRDDAVRLGDGDFAIGATSSGVAELDATSQALAATARRLDAIIQRERAFSADASHQLRTPLTALRVTLESERMAPRENHDIVFDEAIEQIDRLESTIDSLLALARGHSDDRRAVDLTVRVAEATARWKRRADHVGRRIVAAPVEEEIAEPHVSASALDHALDVLIDNALRHGRGRVTISAHPVEGGAAIDVSDEGRIDGDGGGVFHRRRDRSGHGIGLTLARSLIEAEGGDLSVVSTNPTTFRVLLTTADTHR
jgi:signal transduction histidine kinase